ncbi:MAG: tetratricopeptide repeat protein [Terriglobales bacterium]
MKRVFAVASLLFVFCACAFADQGHHHHFDPNEKLGTVHFPISCDASIQKPFERGVALLHTFWYDQARKQFQQIGAKDPKCGMAFWGEAMTLYHQLWDQPDPATVAQGLQLMQKAQQAGAKTAREREYISALTVFYSDSDKLDHDARATAYSNAMAKLSQENPNDHEAGAFYALSLLGSAPPRDATFANQKKAVAILDKLFEQEPDHPGIPHYIIHSCDSPQLAPLGLNAARRYAKIAPSAPHAVHMPSHIFARLGYWQEDIDSNLASVAAAEKTHSTGHELHALDFLNYAYLQTGQDAKAKAVITKAAAIQSMDDMKDMEDYLEYAKVQFPATYAIETRNWKEAETLPLPAGIHPHIAAVNYWAHAVGAGHLRDPRVVEAALQQFDAALEQMKNTKYAYMIPFMDTDRDEIRAWLAFAENKNDEATTIMRLVADKQDMHGKGEVELPAREMLADMLLEMNQPEAALAEYEKSMKVDPNRFNGLYGAARSAELLKQPEKSRQYYAQLVKNCEGSNSDRPELAKAREQLAAGVAVGGK